MMQRARQKGITLIEVLVAMLITGLGLTISLSMLQSALKYQSSSIETTQAIHLMESMMARMRMNSAVASNYLFSEYNFDFDSWDTPTINGGCSGSDCSANLSAAFAQSKKDVDFWIKQLSAELPDGKASIDQPDAGNYPNEYRIELQWTQHLDGERAAAAGQIEDLEPQHIETVFSL